MTDNQVIHEAKGIKPYKDETTQGEIIADGWSRGFEPSQTVGECRAMGFDTSLEWVESRFKLLDEEYMKKILRSKDNE